MDWFLYDISLRRERVSLSILYQPDAGALG